MVQKFDKISNSAHLFQILGSNEDRVIIKFTADWCGPCKRAKPLIDEKLEELPDTVSYYELDVDDCIEIYGFFMTKKMVKGIPAMLCWKKGNFNFIPDYMLSGANPTEINSVFEMIKKNE